MGISTSPATGSRGAVRIGQESVYGRVVQPTHVLEFTSESIGATENIIESEGINEDRGRHKLIRGNLDVGGDISFEQAADGFGKVLRHALGDYIRVPGADGGIRGRMATTTAETVADNDGTNFYVIEFTEDQSGEFADADKLFSLVYRDSSNALVANDNSDSGFGYTSYCGREQTYVISVDDADTTETTANCVAVTVADVPDINGDLVAPDFSTSGGVLRSGSGRRRHAYFAYTPGAGGGANDSVLYLSPATTFPDSGTDNGPNPAASDVIIGSPSLGHTSSYSLPAAVGKGTFLYEYNPAWKTATFGGTGDATVFTHHIERGRRLPVGLTIEVNRDAAIFIYSGMKTASLSLTFDANSIVTGSVTYTGKQEYGPTKLISDIVPGATTVTISNRTTFPSAGTLTIGEETEIAYTAIAASGDYWDLTVAADQIERLHLANSNVDSRTSTEANIYRSAYDAQTGNLTVGETLTFSGGGTAELLALTDDGATGTIVFRMISGTAPAEDETIDNGATGDGTIDGTPEELTPFIGLGSPLTSFETLVYQNGENEEVLSGSLTLTNNLNGDKYGLGSRFRLQLVEEQAVVEASLTLEFDDGKHYLKFTEAEYFTLEFKAISEADDSEIGSTEVYSGAYYFMPKCKYTGTTPQINSTSFIQHDMPVTAVVDDEFNTTDLIIVLVNGNEHDVSVTGL